MNPSSEFKVDAQNKKKTSNEKDVKLSNETNEKKPLFRIDLSHSILGSRRFYYKDVELSNLSIEELNNLKKRPGFYLKRNRKGN